MIYVMIVICMLIRCNKFVTLKMDASQALREVNAVIHKRKYGEKQIHTVPELMKHMKNATKSQYKMFTGLKLLNPVW